MSSFHNHALVQSQVGQQTIYGNVIFNGPGPSYEPSRSGYGYSNSETSIDDGWSPKSINPWNFAHMRIWIYSPHSASRRCSIVEETSKRRIVGPADGFSNWMNTRHGKPNGAVFSGLKVSLGPERRAGVDLYLEFFFSARGAPLQRTPLGMFRSLLHQIFCQDLVSRSFLRDLYKEKCASSGRDDSAWQWQLPELKKGLMNIISACAQRRQIIVFIDALDESGQQTARDLAYYFHSLNDHLEAQAGAVRICISCRHYPVPSTARAVEIHMERHNKGDIETYVRDYLHIDHLSSDLTDRQHKWFMLSKDLIDMASGVFLWIFLVLPMIGQWMADGYSSKAIYKQLAAIPVELHEMYKDIIENVVDNGHGTQSLRLFQWVSLAIRPLSVTEMRYALVSFDINTELRTTLVNWHEIAEFATSDTAMKSWIKSLSGGLVEVVRGVDGGGFVVQVIHQSVNDFLRADGLRLLLSLDPRASSANPSRQAAIEASESIQISHSFLYFSCLRYLCQEFTELFETVEPEANLRWPFLSYAAEYFLVHARRAGIYRGQDFNYESRLLSRCLYTRQFALRPFLATITWPYFRWSLLGTNVLQLAAAAGLQDLVQYRIRCNDDLQAESSSESTALNLALENGHVSVTKTLIIAGSNVQRVDGNGQNALMLAARHGYRDLLSWLIMRGININISNSNGNTPFHVAIGEANFSICKLCLDTGADVNAQVEGSGTALEVAVLHQYDDFLLRNLFERRVDLEASGRRPTAHSTADHVKSERLRRVLLETGVDVYAEREENRIAIRAVACEGKEKFVRLLLEAGADVNARGGRYGGALWAAAAAYIGSERLVRLLLDAGANVNARGGYFGSALQAAMARDNHDTA